MLRLLSLDEALARVRGCTEKPGGVDPALWFRHDAADMLYAFGYVPLDAVRANEAGDRYDGTVDADRAGQYAQRPGVPPPVLLALARDGTILNIIDGGHRITAARLRGAERVPAILRLRRERLLALLAGPDRSRLDEGGRVFMVRLLPEPGPGLDGSRPEPPRERVSQ